MATGYPPTRLQIVAHGMPLVPLPRPLAGKRVFRANALSSPGYSVQMGKTLLTSQNPQLLLGLYCIGEPDVCKMFSPDAAKAGCHAVTPLFPKHNVLYPNARESKQ